MRYANIVTLYKNKGDRSDCNNYRGISLLSIVGKLFARLVLNRLQQVADRVYPESQCGRSTVDMICREQQQPLYMAFIDLTKAFNLMSRNLSLDEERGKRTGKAASTLSRLSKRVWENRQLTITTKIAIYRACVISTLLYGSASWTMYA